MPLPASNSSFAARAPAAAAPASAAAVAPVHGARFDPWNSSSTGHQRADDRSRLRPGWRDFRNRKLNAQFLGRREARGADGLEEPSRPARSVIDMLTTPGLMKDAARRTAPEEPEDDQRARKGSSRGIFDGLVIYVNGSTYPLVSDHMLKRLLRENGAMTSLHLGRRTVTHVILGRPVGHANGNDRGAGGGLAATKLDKEVRKMRGCGVKFVGVEWVLQSLKAGIRLPEARFAHLTLAPKGQTSVYETFSAHAPTTPSGTVRCSAEVPSFETRP
ncbi:hypothetical protein DCS_01549 [Drechmeria coniospora]|uniref:BRCT domain-containing protein n=1 Tax=Drechmeria coniospora TaxID=98403 RepID=A0A151GTS6_DRECN|nr:hypothetical protein DCS_01549 [Drechmeria coniospora]KYK60412.1 hypothetical protein DCS_01549 [Drechmeria coniospora]ODA80352.1 hypothetical protein RJ55_03310 [Drechmeria coniospora]